MRKRDSIKVLLGNNIRMYRKNKGLTQADFASALSCDLKYLGDVENGWFYPSSDLLLRIVDCLGVPVNELFTDHSASHTREKTRNKPDRKIEGPTL